MKEKHTKNMLFNMRLNETEFLIVKILKEKHMINISGAFKKFLQELLTKLEKQDDNR